MLHMYVFSITNLLTSGRFSFKEVINVQMNIYIYISLPDVSWREANNDSSEVCGIIKPARMVKLNRSQVNVHKLLTIRYLWEGGGGAIFVHFHVHSK